VVAGLQSVAEVETALDNVSATVGPEAWAQLDAAAEGPP
jgi:hypothetical protein